jgi:hypothetical protein
MDSLGVTATGLDPCWHSVEDDGLPTSPRAIMWVAATTGPGVVPATWLPDKQRFEPGGEYVTHWRLFDRPPAPGAEPEQPQEAADLEQALDQLAEQTAIVDRLRDYVDRLDQDNMDGTLIVAVRGILHQILGDVDEPAEPAAPPVRGRDCTDPLTLRAHQLSHGHTSILTNDEPHSAIRSVDRDEDGFRPLTCAFSVESFMETMARGCRYRVVDPD